MAGWAQRKNKTNVAGAAGAVKRQLSLAKCGGADMAMNLRGRGGCTRTSLRPLERHICVCAAAIPQMDSRDGPMNASVMASADLMSTT